MKLHDINVEEGRLKNLAMAGALLGAGLGAGCQKAPSGPSKFQQTFRSKAQEADKKRLRDQAEQLRSKGLTKGTFIHGELQEPDDDAGDYEPPNSKHIKSSSVTSDDAADYLD